MGSSFVSIKDKIALMVKAAQAEGRPTSRRHAVAAGVYVDDQPTIAQQQNLISYQKSPRPSGRKAPPPIPRRFNSDQIVQIRNLYSKVKSYRKVAEVYKCSQMTVWAAINGVGAYEVFKVTELN